MRIQASSVLLGAKAFTDVTIRKLSWGTQVCPTREETSVPTISLQMSLVLEEKAVEDRARDGNSVATGEGIKKRLEAIRNLQWFLSRLDPRRDLSQVSSLL